MNQLTPSAPNKDAQSKLALLRNRGAQVANANISGAIDGYADAISTSLEKSIAENSAHLIFIIDNSPSMDGTPRTITQEVNDFAMRQAKRPYKTEISVFTFNDYVDTLLRKVDVKNFTPMSVYGTAGGTNINDAIFEAVSPITPSDAKHRIPILITDGQNGSSQHADGQVHSLVTSHVQQGDHFFLLYNNEHGGDAKQTASLYGIPTVNAENFSRDGDGFKIIFNAIDRLLNSLRTKGMIPEDWAKAIEAHRKNPSLSAGKVLMIGEVR